MDNDSNNNNAGKQVLKAYRPLAHHLYGIGYHEVIILKDNGNIKVFGYGPKNPDGPSGIVDETYIWEHDYAGHLGTHEILIATGDQAYNDAKVIIEQLQTDPRYDKKNYALNSIDNFFFSGKYCYDFAEEVEEFVFSRSMK